MSQVLKVTGTKSLLKRLKKGAELKDVEATVKRHGAEMQQKTMRAVPVDTGNLKRSIQLEIMDNGYTARVHSTAEYAPYVELGTRFMSAQPFLRPSFNVQKNLFLSDMQKLLK